MRKPSNRKASANTAKPESANVPAIIPTETPSTEIVLSGEIIGPEATTEAPATETIVAASADKRAERIALIAADRATVAAIYDTFEMHRASVPVKALSAKFKPEAITAHPIARNISARQCAAIAFAFAASGVKLSDGTTVSRTFEIDGRPFAIENGVLRDAVSSGLLASASADTLTLAPKASRAITAQLGETLLKAANIL